MLALDGNAIAGALHELFGREMTTSAGTCRHCGAHAQMAELRVYLKAPAAVARCPSCASVLLVVGSPIPYVDGFRLDR
jgi:Family of unknown function (DUF6510)